MPFEVDDKVQNADGDIVIVRAVKHRTGLVLIGAEGLADVWVSLEGLTKVEDDAEPVTVPVETGEDKPLTAKERKAAEAAKKAAENDDAAG